MKSTSVPSSLKSDGQAVVPSPTVKASGQTGVSSDHLTSTKSEGQAAVGSSAIKPIGKSGSSSDVVGGGKVAVSAAAKRKAIVSDNVRNVITFKDVTFGPHDGEVQFRLIPFWEAWNPQTKLLIGIEMLLIDFEVGREKEDPIVPLSVMQLLTDISVAVKKPEIADMVFPFFVKSLEEGDTSNS